MESIVCLNSSTPEPNPDQSRVNSNLTSGAQFEGLNIQNINSLNQQPRVSSSSSDLSVSRSYTSAPAQQYINPFPLLPEAESNANWSYLTASEEPAETASLLTLGSTPTYSENQSQQTNPISIRSNTFPTAMSTTGIQEYDTQFNSFHTWPRFELHDQLFSSMPNQGFLYEEPEILSSSVYSRSPSSSPPHGRLSIEQRELKRQRDQARRESKSYMRRARSGSSNRNHYSTSQRTSPDLLPKADYSNSVTASPLLSQCSVDSPPALSTGPFLSAYSPQLPTDIYGQAFIASNDFTSPVTYSIPYSQAEATLPGFLDRPHSLPLSSMTDHMAGLYCPQPVSTRIGPPETSEPVRVVHSRPKPQCWEHGCNGRQFSTFSNLLRHQREKSGAAQKSSCPHCGAEFTRTTARNGHLAHDKCKQRRAS